MDSKTIERIALLHPKVRGEVNEIYKEICERLTGKATCRFTHTLRTFAEQDEIYSQGRTKPGAIVSNAKGGQSYHNYGLAIDIVLILDGKTASWDFITDFDKDGVPEFEEIDFVFKMYGWDGLYKANGQRWDLPHFQKTFGWKTPDLLKAYNAKLVDVNGYVII